MKTKNQNLGPTESLHCTRDACLHIEQLFTEGQGEKITAYIVDHLNQCHDAHFFNSLIFYLIYRSNKDCLNFLMSDKQLSLIFLSISNIDANYLNTYKNLEGYKKFLSLMAFFKAIEYGALAIVQSLLPDLKVAVEILNQLPITVFNDILEKALLCRRHEIMELLLNYYSENKIPFSISLNEWQDYYSAKEPQLVLYNPAKKMIADNIYIEIEDNEIIYHFPGSYGTMATTKRVPYEKLTFLQNRKITENELPLYKNNLLDCAYNIHRLHALLGKKIPTLTDFNFDHPASAYDEWRGIWESPNVQMLAILVKSSHFSEGILSRLGMKALLQFLINTISRDLEDIVKHILKNTKLEDQDLYSICMHHDCNDKYKQLIAKTISTRHTKQWGLFASEMRDKNKLLPDNITYIGNLYIQNF